MAEQVEAMGDMDVPKFNDLLIAFRVATVRQKRKLPNERGEAQPPGEPKP